MLLSMTGYGKAEYFFADHKTIVEIRSVNSKQLDLTLKLASNFREREMDIRAMLLQPLERGKVDVTIYTQQLDSTAPSDQFTPVCWEAVRFYTEAYKQEMGVNEVPSEVMASILRFPDVMRPKQTAQESLPDEEYALLQQAVHDALEAFIGFRRQEGASLQAMFINKLDGIAALLADVEPLEATRVDGIRQRLIDNLEKLTDKSSKSEKVAIAYDKNRLEAEMIYYLEKLDVTEEKVRLKNHIRYFHETMHAEGNGVGKKLGFVAQEMGREINTLGSKSNQSEMQVIVVKMKDLLEQIKEQVLNVL